MTVDIYHTVCGWLRELIAGTSWEGHVFAVGGCCRDEVMNRPINDIDLAVDIENGGLQFADWLEERNLTVAPPVRFERYGTAMLHLRAFPDHEIEVVQTRCGKYTDENAENPGSVFGTIADDVMRRDFTVNSLFYDISRDKLLDLTGRGLADIQAHCLRTPMDPEMTFFDDPVRILRCIRMATVWGWSIDDDTMQAMRANVPSLREIKPERRRAEFEKMLKGPDPVRALELLRTTGAMRYVFPEMENCYRVKVNGENITLWQRALRAVAATETDNDYILRLAALLHVLGWLRTVKNPGPNAGTDRALLAARSAESALRRIKYHGQFVREITFLIRNQSATLRWGHEAENAKDRMIRRLCNLCVTDQRLERLLSLIHAINVSTPHPMHRPQQIPRVRERLGLMGRRFTPDDFGVPIAREA